MNLDTLDKSFLRLVTDFTEAKGEMMENSQYVNKDAIVISPTEIYTQISNSLTSIAFDDSYIVELVDCNDNALLDITNKVFINEFQDINGIYQIAFEVAPINQEFYFKRLFFRFKHIGSDLTVWSNPFICTDRVHSVRLDYKCYSYYQGISYDRANIYQSIRIATFYSLPSTKETVKISTLTNGDIRRSRPIQALEYTYTIEALDTFTFDRLSNLLNSDVVYLNGVRFKASENAQSDERQGVTNQFSSSFKGQFDATDKYTAGYQIAPDFVAIVLAPLGLYTLASFPFSVSTSDFSNNIESVSYLKLYNYDTETFIQNIPFTIVSNSIDLDFTLISLTNGNYYITTELTSILGQVLTIENKDVWKFSIQEGQYNNTQYNNSQYFTN